MNVDERLVRLSEARFQIGELISTLKTLGSRYLNTIDMLGDIQSSIDIDADITMRTQYNQAQMERRMMTAEYYRMT